MFRSSPPEVFSKKEAQNNHAEARSQQSRFATLLKSHPRTDIFTHSQNTSLQETTSGVLKDLNY